MKVLELQPAKRVLWQVVGGPEEWIGTKISFDLKQTDDHAIVLVGLRAGRLQGLVGFLRQRA
jgi:hypothetical protein